MGSLPSIVRQKMGQNSSSDLTLSHVYVIDDNQACRTATARLVSEFGYSVSVFASAEDFLNHDRSHERSCAIVDNRMLGMSGMDLQAKLVADGDPTAFDFPNRFCRNSADRRSHAKRSDDAA